MILVLYCNTTLTSSSSVTAHLILLSSKHTEVHSVPLISFCCLLGFCNCYSFCLECFLSTPLSSGFHLQVIFSWKLSPTLALTPTLHSDWITILSFFVYIQHFLLSYHGTDHAVLNLLVYLSLPH